MKAAHKHVMSACMFALCLLCVCGTFCTSCHSGSRNSLSEMREIEVIHKADPMDPIALSPDGALVAHFGTGFGPSPVFDGKILEIREVNSSRQAASIQVPVAGTIPAGAEPVYLGPTSQLQFCNRGKYLLALDHAEKIHVFDTHTNQLRATIDLYPMEDPPPPEILAMRKSKSINYTGRSGGLQFAACAANAPIAAFFIYYEMGLGSIKIFNLDTGVQVPGFDSLPMLDSALGIAVSPLGTSIAIFREEYHPVFEPGGDYDHVVAIIDLKTKRIAKNINLISDRNLGSFPIAFVGESTVAVQLFKREHDVPTPKDRFRYRFRASIHFFDIGTGSQVQVITDPFVDDFDFAGMSADGHTLLAYTGKSHTCTYCNHGFGQQAVTDARVTLWNRETGKPIAQSPSLKVIHHTCPWYSIFDKGGAWGSCSSSDYIPSFAMSQNGNAVVVTWPMATEPVEVYTLPTH